MSRMVPLGDIPAWHAAGDPGRVAVRCGDRTVTYAELDRRSTALAHAYRERGVSGGELVALLLPNSVELFEALFAIWKLGATPVPMPSQLPVPERHALLELAEPSLAIGATGLPVPGVAPGFEPDDRQDPLPPVEPTQPWKAICSGGSTGRPKLIVSGRPAVADPAEPQYGIRPGDVVLVPGPMYHQGPFIFATGGLFTGNPVVVMTHFDPEEALGLIERHRVTWTYFVPTMTQRIWRLEPDTRDAYDLSSLRIVMSTGAPWAPWLKEAWIRWLGPERILEGYGGSEEHGGLTITGDEALAHPGSVGRAHEGMRVLDERGADVPRGAMGELYFRSTDSTGRYVGAEHHPVDGWRSYGDIGYIAEDGYVYLADRRTDMIVSGGANVYPAEVEGALEAHPAVRSAVVIGLPDEDLGQRVHALVDVPGMTVPADELRTHLRERIAGFKVPKTYEFVSQPLRDDAGKVRRASLRQERLGSPSS
jgi:bile acid-coenzyme A ligase